MSKLFFTACLVMSLGATVLAQAEDEDLQILESINESAQAGPYTESPELQLAKATTLPNNFLDPTRYTLGPDDVIDITVMRHTEFSGVFPVNQEGKVQLKFVGDIDVTGLTKSELEKKIKEVIATYVTEPEITVTILEYKSKVIYVLGEVGMPGKYYMRSESIPVREAVVQAGLPTLSAAMRRCQLVTPTKEGKAKNKAVDLYSVLYGGDLKKNISMVPGDVLYVPATVMAKIIRVISPVTQTVGVTASAPSEAQSGRSAVSALTSAY